ncbi:MAG: 2-isopropylmalate synthase [Andreesenia angusta]|nr:2-isopropylmalate synthase [Andreesenia angusta]
MKNKNYFRDIFPYTEVPKMNFTGELVPMDIPEEIWVTDTTFRDGQQSMASFSVEQISTIFDYLNKIDNNSGIIRQSEFFLYTDKDKEAVKICREKGYEFPEITAWIRAKEEDLKLVKELEIGETGMLMSCSDYHIYDKLKMNREKAMEYYLNMATKAIELGIKPRCHLEDITRSDFNGFVIPLVKKLMELSKESGMDVKIRACDTMGLGLPYNGTELPRSVPAIMHGLRKEAGVESRLIEWHGHNDFYSVVNNSSAAWQYGCAGVNGTLFGIGERTGNCPIEGMLIEYAQIKGTLKDMDLKYLPELAHYFDRELGHRISEKTPFVGDDFNVTKAGIHADGLLKNEEIYNAFDTRKILGRPPLVAVNQYSGLAGIAAWVNGFYNLDEDKKFSKRDEKLTPIKNWVDRQYDNGRSTVIRNDELRVLAEEHLGDIIK